MLSPLTHNEGLPLPLTWLQKEEMKTETESCCSVPPCQSLFLRLNFSIWLLLPNDFGSRLDIHESHKKMPPPSLCCMRSKDKNIVVAMSFNCISQNIHWIYHHFHVQWNVTQKPNPQAANKVHNGLVSFCCLNFPWLHIFSRHFNFPIKILPGHCLVHHSPAHSHDEWLLSPCLGHKSKKKTGDGEFSLFSKLFSSFFPL